MDLEEGTRLILLGKTGVGKSAIANALTGKNVFKSALSSKSTTHHVQKEEAIIDDNKVEVYDTPGLFGTDQNDDEVRQKLDNLIQDCKSSNSIFLVVLRPDRFTDDDRETVAFIESILGNDLQHKTWIIFSHGDKLEQDGNNIDAIIKSSPPLRLFVEKCEERIHVFSTKAKPADQVHGLLSKLKQWKKKLSARIQMNAGCLGSPKNTTKGLTDRRILLLGKTGVGKSATGNTILGQNVFTSERSLSSVTQTCEVQTAVFEDKMLHVTDTPGFFDTELSDEEFVIEMGKSFFDCPGPHAFLYVVPLNTRFTEQDMDVIENVKIMYGESVWKHSIVVFTFGDKYKKKDIPIMIERNRFLRKVLQQCNQRYIVFNNNDKGNKSQVTKLMSAIDDMVAKNKGHYTSEMFELARKAQEEKLDLGKDVTQLIEKLENAPDEEKDNIIQKIKAIQERIVAEYEKHTRAQIEQEFCREHSLEDANTNDSGPKKLGHLQMPRDSQAELQTGCQGKPGTNQVQESETQPVVGDNNPDVQGVRSVPAGDLGTSEQQSNPQNDTWYQKLWNSFKSAFIRFWKFLQDCYKKICSKVLCMRSDKPSCSTMPSMLMQ